MPSSERRQLLAELIVHLARDPLPLVLLRKGQPGVQLGAGAFGQLALPISSRRASLASASSAVRSRTRPSSSSCARRSSSSARFRSLKSKWVPTIRTTGPPGSRRTEGLERALARSGHPCGEDETHLRTSARPRIRPWSSSRARGRSSGCSSRSHALTCGSISSSE